MTSQILLELYKKDIIKLKEEISFYKNESDLWLLKGDVKNSPGTLALHIAGNLKHFCLRILYHVRGHKLFYQVALQ